MEKPESRSGTLAWAGLVAGIALWDVYGPETLSHACHRHMEHPVKKTLIAASVGLTALHLLKLVDREHDIFYAFGRKDTP